MTTKSKGEALDLNKLEALAKAATPGPWNAQAVVGYRGRLFDVRQGISVGVAGSIHDPANASYIAAANPAAILELIALARRSLPVDAAGIKTWKERRQDGHDIDTAMLEEIADLRAALARASSAAPAGQQADEHAAMQRENAEFTEWWANNQACPEHNLITENAAHATWQERARRERSRLAAPAAAEGPSAELRAALQEFVDYHTKPAGLSLEVLRDESAYKALWSNIDAQQKAMVERAQALLTGTANKSTKAPIEWGCMVYEGGPYCLGPCADCDQVRADMSIAAQPKDTTDTRRDA